MPFSYNDRKKNDAFLFNNLVCDCGKVAHARTQVCRTDNSGKWEMWDFDVLSNLPIFGPETLAKTDDFAKKSGSDY